MSVERGERSVRRMRRALDRAWVAWLESKWPVVRFVLVFGLLIGAFYAVYAPSTKGAVFTSYLALITEVCGAILRLLGQGVTVTGPMIVSPRFSIEVVTGCDGIEATALFAAAVLASPVSLRSRLLFLLAGTAVLMVVNLLRIVSLFCVGVYFPNAMDVMHFDAWPGVLIVLVLLCWLIWARWAARRGGLYADAA
ncbi:MAG: archaeosortase/exosortase family protein [Phycisphaerae bacterium]